MPSLDKKHLDFDSEDVKLMSEMLRKYINLNQATQVTPAHPAYLPLFALSLLRSEQSIERLTKWMIVLTVAIVLLTSALVYLTSVMLFRGAS